MDGQPAFHITCSRFANPELVEGLPKAKGAPATQRKPMCQATYGAPPSQRSARKRTFTSCFPWPVGGDDEQVRVSPQPHQFHPQFPVQ